MDSGDVSCADDQTRLNRVAGFYGACAKQALFYQTNRPAVEPQRAADAVSPPSRAFPGSGCSISVGRYRRSARRSGRFLDGPGLVRPRVAGGHLPDQHDVAHQFASAEARPHRRPFGETRCDSRTVRAAVARERTRASGGDVVLIWEMAQRLEDEQALAIEEIAERRARRPAVSPELMEHPLRRKCSRRAARRRSAAREARLQVCCLIEKAPAWRTRRRILHRVQPRPDRLQETSAGVPWQKRC